jgi:hypothetical protein
MLVGKEDLYGGHVLTASPWAAFFFAMMAAFVVANLIGYPALRLKGHYLAMATLGFGLIVNKMLLGSAITGSADGINGVPEWRLGFGLTVSGKSGLRVENYYIACGLVLLLLALLNNLVHSRVGRALQSIHDRETAANAMGLDTAAPSIGFTLDRRRREIDLLSILCRFPLEWSRAFLQHPPFALRVEYKLFRERWNDCSAIVLFSYGFFVGRHAGGIAESGRRRGACFRIRRLRANRPMALGRPVSSRE